jgi:single-strand DNA-binding protein
MFNRVILIGNLTKDPDVRYTPGGTPVATVRIAVTSRFKQADEMRDETLFIDVVTFGRQAETCGQYLNKGNPILVEGRLRERKWESEGTQKSKFEVLANTIRFLPKRDMRQQAEDSKLGDTTPPEEVTDVEPF